MQTLPPTGSADLLAALSPHLDDGFINELFPRKPGRGRRRLFCAAQLFRTQLLSLLTSTHSFNLLVTLLAENRAWRDFALLPNKRILPDAKMLHEFRDQFDLIKLRAINRNLLAPLLASRDCSRKAVAIMDSTDLPAATHSFKKKSRAIYGKPGSHWIAHGQKRTKPLVHRLQETHAALVAARAWGFCFAGAAHDMDCACQSRGCAVFRAGIALLRRALVFPSRSGCSRHGLHQLGYAKAHS
jgi:hypothetical protein